MADVAVTELPDEAAVAGLRGGFEVLHDPDLVDVPISSLAPHIATITAESNRRVSAVTAEGVRRRLEVEPG